MKGLKVLAFLMVAMLAFGQKIDINRQTQGTLEISRGGTGETSASAAINALVPSQFGQVGKYLTTDGSGISWDFPILSTTVGNLPASPSQGTVYFVTDGDTTTDCTTGAGSSLVLCYYDGASWIPYASGGGSTGIELQIAGLSIGPPLDILNVDSGTSIILSGFQSGGKNNLNSNVNSAIVATRTQVQSGQDLLVVPTSGSGSAYTANLIPALTSYTNGMVIQFRPDVNNTGACTLDINNQGPIDILEADGSTDPGSGDLVAGRQYALYYDSAIPAFVMPPAAGGGGGSGTVTSVGLSMPPEFSVASSPVTTSGTIAVTKATQTARTIYAGPTTGSAAAPTFRALTRDDIPPADRIVFSGVDTTGNNTTVYVPVLSYTFGAGEVQVGDIIQVDFTVERGSGSDNGAARITMNGAGSSFANLSSGAPVQGLLNGRVLIFVGTAGWTARYEPGYNNTGEVSTNNTEVLTNSWTLDGAVYSANTASRYYMRRMVVRIIR